MNDTDPRLEVAHEELRVADEEVRTQQEVIDGLLRGRAADRLAVVRLSAALPVPLVETDRDGLILQANPAAAGLFHVDAARLRGKPLAVLVDAGDRRALRSALARALATGTTEHLTVAVTPRHDGAVPVDAVVLPEDPAPGAGEAAARWVLSVRSEAGPGVDTQLLTALGGVSTLTVVDGDLRSVLTRLASLVVQGVPSAVSASVVVGSPSVPAVLATTDALAQALEGLQQRSAEGPSWDAYEARGPVTAAELGADPRWPVLAPLVPAGTDGTVAIPLLLADRPAGVLTVYGSRSLGDPGTLRRAMPFADAATALLREHDTIVELRRQEGQLRDALTSRATIDQAKGILMARLGVDADAAFAVLTRRSQHANVKLREVARQLIEEAAAVSPSTPTGSAPSGRVVRASPSRGTRPTRA
jgi:PAS domain-containing protein